MTASLVALTIATSLVVAVAMEAWAALLHGRVWHRVLWPVHASHHRRRRGTFETNDLLSALHAPIAIGLVVHGCQEAPGATRALTLGAGYGMTLFGLAYIVCHDGFVHRRLPVRFLQRFSYFARVARAHRAHHALGGPPYGFFAAPFTTKVSAHGRARARFGDPTATAARAASSAERRRTRWGGGRRRRGGSG